MLLKYHTQYAIKFGKHSGGHRTQDTGKDQFYIPIPTKGNAKECSNNCTVTLISHASKIILKILQVRLQHYENLQMYKLDLEKTEEQEIKLPVSIGSLKM